MKTMVPVKWCCLEIANENKYIWEPRIEISVEDKSFNILGCCNSCHVLSDIKHCPYCGFELSKLELEERTLGKD